MDETLNTLTGRTALFVVSDGKWDGGDNAPIELATKMVSEHDLCIYVISTAKDKINERSAQRIADLNSCSRLIPIDNFLDRQEYTIGALFDVKATERIKEHPQSYLLLKGYTDNVGG